MDLVSIVPHANKNVILTMNDRLMVDVILVGCTKMMFSIVKRNAKKSAMSSSKLETKSLAYTSVLYTLPKVVEENPVLRPYNLREKLPNQFRKIPYEILTQALNFLVRINILETANKDKVKAKRGHPFTSVRAGIPGPNSYYRPTLYYNSLKNVLSKTEAVELIYRVLLESVLLYKYVRFIELYKIYVMRNHGKETAWNICHPIFPVPTIEMQDFENKYRVSLASNDDRIIEEIATTRAKVFVETHTAKDYIYLYTIGAFYFRA